MSAEELVRSCAEVNDGAAWEEFVGRFRRPISLSILRVAYQWSNTPQRIVDDLVQETYLKLCADRCRLLHAFAADHPDAVLGYIKAIAANVAHDHFKSLHSQKRGSGEASQIEEGFEGAAPPQDLSGQAAIERAVLLREIDRCLENCSEGPYQERDRLIFWLYYQQGMSAKAIAALPAVDLSSKGVESAIFRLTRLVREQIVRVGSRAAGSSEQGEKGFRAAESY